MKKIISLLTAFALSLTTYVCYAEASEPDVVDGEVVISESQAQPEEQQADETIIQVETVENSSSENDNLIADDNESISSKYKRRVDYKDFNIDECTYAGTPYRVMEKVTFDFTMDSSVENSYIGDIATAGSKIDGTLQQIILPYKQDVLLLSLQGNKGTAHYWQSTQEFGWKSNWISFRTDLRYDDGDLVNEDGVEYIDYIELRGIENSGEMGFSISVTPDLLRIYTQEELDVIFIDEEPTYKANADNIVYESDIDTESTIEKNRNFAVLFGLTREKLVEEAQKVQSTEKQDPERYVKKMKGVNENGEPFGYRIDFVAQVDIDLSGNTMPDWYKNLGDNVTATMIGITRTYGDTTGMSYPLLVFYGDEGKQWFMMSEMGVSDGFFSGNYKNGTNPVMDFVFIELISFDGYDIVRNTLEYEQTTVNIEYSNDGRLTPLGIEFKIGGKTQYSDADEIKYIGGGDLSYETFVENN